MKWTKNNNDKNDDADVDAKKKFESKKRERQWVEKEIEREGEMGR